METSTHIALGRILIVDDENVLLDALCDTLRDNGYFTVGFTSASKALKFLSANEFDLILSDLNMPEMDGITFLQRATEIDVDIVGIIMTGQGSINSAVEAMKTGALDYIQKPFKLKAILPILSRAMSLRALKQENVRLNAALKNRTEELEIVVRDLEAFSSYISHDLKGPLGFIRNFAKIVLEEHGESLTPTVEACINKISQFAVQMEGLIEDLLEFSKSGRKALSIAEMDMKLMVDKVIELAQPDTNKYNLVVKDMANGLGDENLILQVLTNLISNAIKYSGKKENPVIEIGSLDQETEIIYYVKDNGAGFELEDSDLLFKAFKRVHDESEFAGTGIGLAIAKRIVNRHNGRIWAEGAKDQGATFYFGLPKKQS